MTSSSFWQVEEVFVHPDYDPETVDNDVALLRLPEAIKLGQQGTRLACLPQPGQSLPITQKCTIIGWGKKRSSHVFGTEVLHEAEVIAAPCHLSAISLSRLLLIVIDHRK